MHGVNRNCSENALLLLESLFKDLRDIQLRPDAVCSFQKTTYGNFTTSIENLFQFPISNKVQLSFQYRYGTIFREVVKAEFEWCSLVDGTSKDLLALSFGELIKQTGMAIFKPCPYPVVSSYDLVVGLH